MTTHSKPTASSSEVQDRPWYRETAMMVVIGVLASTFLVSSIIITLAINSDDPLVISEQDYQSLKDEMRASKPKEQDNDNE